MPPCSDQIILYDTEYWSSEGALERNWGGIHDHPPHLIQIGAYKVECRAGLPVSDEFVAYIVPRDAAGAKVPLTGYFSDLTGISQDFLDLHARELSEVMDSFGRFCGPAPMYSYGLDMLQTIVPSCFLQRIPCPFDPGQSRDIRQIFVQAGLTESELGRNSSGTLAGYLGIDMPSDHQAHDALSDVNSLLQALRYLERHKKMDAKNLFTQFCCQR